MKKRLVVFGLMVLMLGLAAPPVFAQGASGTVKGVCKDAQGNPIADGIVIYANQDNGQKYTLKTNKKGEYFSLGITPGSYLCAVYKNADDLKADKRLDFVNKFQVTLDENSLDFNLKQEAEKQAKGEGLTPEQLKQRQEQQAKQQKEVGTVKQLNEKLDTANAA